ncbi:MAG: hypothetical protein ACRDFS_03565 [Chloroflexota bacterium]
MSASKDNEEAFASMQTHPGQQTKEFTMRPLACAAALAVALLVGGPYAGRSAASVPALSSGKSIVIRQSDVHSAGYRLMSVPGPTGHPIPETKPTWNKHLWKAHGYLGG